MRFIASGIEKKRKEKKRKKQKKKKRKKENGRVCGGAG
jgi:hypothetical protein